VAATIERRRSLDPLTAARFAAIYEESFPAGERDDTSSLLASIAAGERVCDLAVDGAELLGFAVTLALEDVDVVLLEYLAVDRTLRNGGVGRRLLEHLRAQLSVPGMLLEVEPPEDATGADAELRRRRIGFYERNGAVVIEGAAGYRAPRSDAAGAYSYVLMWLGISEPAPPQGAYLADCVSAVLTQSYGLDVADPLVRSVVAELGG
jgi:GNAT superfamily N-acetyltransferase